MGSLILATAQLLFALIPDLMDFSSKLKENSLKLFKRWKEIIDEKEETRKANKGRGINAPRHDNSSPDMSFHVKTKNVKLDHSNNDTDACHADPELKSPLYSDDKNLPNTFEVNQVLEYISNAKGIFEDNIKILNLLEQIISGESCDENIEVIERLCTCRDNSYGEHLVENSSKCHLMRLSDDSLDLLTGCQLPSSISEEELQTDSERKNMSGCIEYASSSYFMDREHFLEMQHIGLTHNYEQVIEKQNQLEKENAYLKKQLQSLEIKCKELLNELGEAFFEQDAKENEKRKSELFQRLFFSSVYKNKQFSEDWKKDSQSDRPKVHNISSPSNFPRTTYENNTSVGDDSSLVNEPALREKPAPGAEALRQNDENDPEKERGQTGALENNKSEFGNVNKGIQINKFSSKNEKSSKKIIPEPTIDLLQQRVAIAQWGKENQGRKYHQTVQAETITTKRTSDFGSPLKQGTTSGGYGKEIQVKQGKTNGASAKIDLGPSFENGVSVRGQEYEIKVNQRETEEIKVAGGVKFSSRQGLVNCSTDNTNHVMKGATSATKRISTFGSSITRRTTSGDESKANVVIQGEDKGASVAMELRSPFEHGATSGGKGFEIKVIQGETKETKVAGKVGSHLQQGTMNCGKVNKNRVNEGEAGTTKTARDFGSSSTRATTSQGDAKKTNKIRDLGHQNVDQSSIRQSYESLSFSVQQDDRNGTDYISLSNIPPISVATTLYNNYKLLLITLAEKLLSSQVLELKNWASQKFSINISNNATDVLLRLDQNGVINASNLRELRDFFESILRYDLLHIIDTFLLGDYSLLWQTSSIKRKTTNDQTRRSIIQQTTPTSEMLFNNGHFSSTSSSVIENPVLGTANHQQIQVNAIPTNISDNSTHLSRELPDTNFTTNPNNLGQNDLRSSAQHERQSIRPTSTTPIATGMTNTVVADHSVTSNDGANENSQTIESNGFKLSKFQSSDPRPAFAAGSSENQATRNQDIDWLCSHYRRRCYVKFECCDKFWPCHRCHNNESTCGRKKLKARDTKMLKCVNCGTVQQFGEFCCECNIKFANYYCGLCKHLTGTDDHPYHCHKCGICRIHADRSFHCDICGVCLDVQLRGNHKCREDSAHDECCICLEDAFTGCQIFPCSHKVHKECVTQMIRSGITRCPICRESFAHKLEPRPKTGSRKSSGK